MVYSEGKQEVIKVSLCDCTVRDATNIAHKIYNEKLYPLMCDVTSHAEFI